MATVTRGRLSDAVHRETGLPRREAAGLVDAVIEAIAERLAAGEPVKLSGFGAFSVRGKGARMGRNPRTGEAAPIAPRRVVTFRASGALKSRIAEGQAQAVKRAMGEASETISTSSGPSLANARQAATSASESNVP